MAAKWDVVVVGAGPAGSTSALLLARLGYRVLLLERAHFPRPKACAEYMSPGVAAVFERLQLGDVRRELSPKAVSGMEIVAPSGKRLRMRYEIDGELKSASTLPRQRLDAALAGAAVAAGVELREGFTAQRSLRSERGVVGIEGRTRTGSESIHAPLTIVADGARSALSKSLGLDAPVRWPVRLGLVAHYAGEPRLSDGYGEMHVRPGGYCGIAPLPDGLVNVAVVGGARSMKGSGQAPADFLQSWIDTTPELRIALAGCRRVSPVRGMTPIGSRSRSAVTAGALLVGDAASFFDPFTGEGIHRALVGAELVAGVAHRALMTGDVSRKGMSVYDRLRRETFRRKAAVTALVQLFVQFPWLMEYALPRLARRPAPRDTLGLVLGDLVDAGQFLTPRMLFGALRP